MSGTSLDGVDGVLVDFAGDAIQVQQHATLAFPESLRAEFLALNTATTDELHRAALAGNALARLYAQVVAELMARSGQATHSIVAVGAHGQTVRHRPKDFDGTGYTLQVNQPALLAELCGIDVVADFRSRDLAAGGQGAPLVPPFHAAFFGRPGTNTSVLNIGGISNLTVLSPLSGSALLTVARAMPCWTVGAPPIPAKLTTTTAAGRPADRFCLRCWNACLPNRFLPLPRPKARGAIFSTANGWTDS
jgi:anhydro-N-acetylmuramic acid kinase